MEDSIGEKQIITFHTDGHFSYKNVTENSSHDDQKEQWKLIGQEITFSFNKGYWISKGEISSDFSVMKGTWTNDNGLKGTWTGKKVQ